MQNVMSMSMPSNNNYSFSTVPQANIPRSAFKRPMTVKDTIYCNYLTPFYVQEVLPGDSFNVNATMFARLTTSALKNPPMDNLYLDTFYIFVPNRLLQSNWEKLNGAQDNPDDSTDFQTPIVTSPEGGFLLNTLYEKFGLPIGIAGLEINNLFARAYNKAWNDLFRDENLQDMVVVDQDDGPDDPADYVLLKRGKRKDYFTSCLPWPQKGPAVELPLGSTAPVTGLALTATAATNNSGLFETDGSTWSSVPSSAATNMLVRTQKTGAVNNTTNKPQIFADLSSATAATINDLREAFAVQRVYERDARGGTRYVELLKSHFGVTSPDFRLQRAEYLGGNSQPISINPIAQTSETSTTPLGSLGGLGAVVSRNGFTKSFVEHGIILGLVSPRADLTYQQGVHKMFLRRDRFDFYLPALSHLGEQAVLNIEIFAQGPDVKDSNNVPYDDLVFGYQERWAEYRYNKSQIKGLFRSDAVGTLDSWHLSQDFANLPVLNDEFIEEDVPINRIKAVNTQPDFVLDVFIDEIAVRPMPTYSVPGMMDHF